MDLTNKQDLENHFAENFDTRLFPILAEHYLEDEELDRAQKVCEIGLGYHPENADGWYILAKVHFDAGNVTETEKCLKNVAKFGRSHLQARIELAEIQTMLNRAPNTLIASWKKVLRLAPAYEQALAELERLSPQKPAKPVYVAPPTQEEPEVGLDEIHDAPTDDEADDVDQLEELAELESVLESELEQDILSEELTEEEPKQKPKPEPFDPASINISPRMATMTLARVFKEQGLYYQSLAVLDILDQKGENFESIELERKDVQHRMYEAQKEAE